MSAARALAGRFAAAISRTAGLRVARAAGPALGPRRHASSPPDGADTPTPTSPTPPSRTVRSIEDLLHTVVKTPSSLTAVAITIAGQLDNANHAAAAEKGRADEASGRVNEAIRAADQAIGRADEASGRADAEKGRADEAIRAADQASGRANVLQQLLDSEKAEFKRSHSALLARAVVENFESANGKTGKDERRAFWIKLFKSKPALLRAMQQGDGDQRRSAAEMVKEILHLYERLSSAIHTARPPGGETYVPDPDTLGHLGARLVKCMLDHSGK